MAGRRHGESGGRGTVGRTAAAAVALALLAAQPASRPTEDGPDEPVVHEFTYQWGGSARAQAAGVSFGLYTPCPGLGCAVVDVGRDHRWLELEVVDDSGLPVMLASSADGVPRVCGRSADPIRLGRGIGELAVEVAAGNCPDGTPSLPTSGTMRITLHTTDPLA